MTVKHAKSMTGSRRSIKSRPGPSLPSASMTPHPEREGLPEPSATVLHGAPHLTPRRVLSAPYMRSVRALVRYCRSPRRATPDAQARAICALYAPCPRPGSLLSFATTRPVRALVRYYRFPRRAVPRLTMGLRPAWTRAEVWELVDNVWISRAKPVDNSPPHPLHFSHLRDLSPFCPQAIHRLSTGYPQAKRPDTCRACATLTTHARATLTARICLGVAFPTTTDLRSKG